MMIKLSNKTKGLTAASGTALLQGIEGILFMFLGIYFLKSSFDNSGFSIATSTIKEILTFTFLAILVRPSKIIKLMKRVINNKDTRKFFFAGLIGTSFGNLFYISAIQLAGASYGTILTSLYPIFTLLLFNKIFKSDKKENWKVFLGITISLVGSMLFIIIPSILSTDGSFTLKTILGIVFGALAALFWTIEGLLLSLGMKKKSNKDITGKDIVIIRSVATMVMTVLIVFPSFMLISKTSSIGIKNPANIFGDIVSDYRTMLIMGAISSNLLILRSIHVYAVQKIGAKLSSVIDTNNFIVPPLLSIGLQYSGLKFIGDETNIFSAPTWWSWFLIIPIIIGVVIVLIYKQDKPYEKFEKILN